MIVGAGPAGSSAAAFLARSGIRVLLLDKATFPREKVCGDGLTPKALYWLDVLGCVDEVLDASRSFFTQGDIFIGGERVLTAAFPKNTPYPEFSILLERKKLDHILVRHAVACGAAFRPGCNVKGIRLETGGVAVEADCDGTRVLFRSKIVVAADGANSILSRAIGNRVLDGTTAASMRGYYEGVRVEGSKLQIHFDEDCFPGYGWLFVDDDGKANAGLGYVFDRNFPVRISLRKAFQRFLDTRLEKPLRKAKPLGKPRGGLACYYMAARKTADRVLLIGDAANAGDPINGGGIHCAIESAHLAAEAIRQAVEAGDCSAQSLGSYERQWNERNGMDWRTGELLLSVAKNPYLSRLNLYLLKTISAVARDDARFQEFCGGVFSGATPARETLCPKRLFEVTPFAPGLWLSALLQAEKPGIKDLAGQTLTLARAGLRMAEGAAAEPVSNAAWLAEILSKMAGLAGCYARRELAQLSREVPWPADARAGWEA